MSGEALKSLGDELQILAGETSARETIERYGFRCGEGLAQKLGLGTVSAIELRDLLPDLIIETGLGRSRAVEASDDGIVIDFEDSVEAGAIGKAAAPSCRFTSGYMAGLLSSLLDRRMQGLEESCIASGAASCRHVFTPSKADFKPANEVPIESACKYCLNDATGYLIKEETGEKSYEVFTEHVTHGHQGLCVTRDFPTKIRKRYGLEKTPIIWLSTEETTEMTVAPQNLSSLYYQIESFLKKSEKGIVLLSGMEYMISQNSYSSVLKFIQLLNELIAVRSAILLVSLSPLTLDEKDLKTLERELENFAPKEKVVNMMD